MPARNANDTRPGAGMVPLGSIRCATLLIDSRCICNWIVIEPGPGLASVSAVKYLNALCPVRHRRVPAEAVAGGS